MSASVKAARMMKAGPRAMPGTGFQGDPGLFGFLGGVAKGALNIVGASGIPGVSGVAKGLTSIFGNKSGSAKAQQLAAARFGGGTIPGGFWQGPGVPTNVRRPGVLALGQSLIPGGETGLGAGCGQGFHPNKSDYFLKTGEYVAKGSRCVRNRKRNPLNPRAFDRALSRIDSANNFKKKLARITIRPKKCPA